MSLNSISLNGCKSILKILAVQYFGQLLIVKRAAFPGSSCFFYRD